MQRSLFVVLRQDLGKKILLISGPRQSGKTTLAQTLEANRAYLNYDIPDKMKYMIEAKWADDRPSRSFKAFESARNDKLVAIQLVGQSVPTRDYPFGVRVCTAAEWLKNVQI